MNPKYPANLDPKLREAYDRVMGTGAKPKEHQPTPQPEQHPKAPARMVTETVHKQQNDNDSGVVHYGPDTHTKHKFNTGEQHETKQEAKPDPAPTHASAPSEKTDEPKSSATPILLGIIGVLFLLGYALFWAQIFGFNVVPAL